MKTMQSGTTFTSPIDSQPTLRLKRPLIPVDQYMARENIARNVLDEYGKLGIIQIRRFRGKTFVVDLPFVPNPYTSDTTPITPKPVKNTPPKPKNPTPTARNTLRIDARNILSRPQQSPARTAQAVDILTKKTPPAPQKAPQPAPTHKPKLNIAATPAPAKTKPPAIPQLQKPAPTTTTAPAPVETTQTAPAHEPQDQTASIWTWRNAALAAILAVAITAALLIWLHIDRQLQISRIDHANTVIEAAYGNSLQANHKIQSLENRLVQSEAQITTIENELFQVRQGLKNIQQRNVQAAERLNIQIQRLTNHMSELAATKP